MRSLAADRGERAIGVILSGAASDGAQGLAAIKSEGGVTFAQEPSSAEYPSMPANAMGARAVDFVLPPGEMGRELARLGADGSPTSGGASTVAAGDASSQEDEEAQAFDEIFALLRAALSVDFSAYKLPTIRRRITRRMLVRRSPDLASYVRLLHEDPAEVEALYRDILIMVTEFFRDPETFAVLRKRVLPAILEGKGRHAPVRIWVPGCASGEEAYSLAISLREVMTELHVEAKVKIFATDISEPDLERARRGSFTESIADAVVPDLLQRHFTRTESGYQIAKAIREQCVFARHDVTHDPPFANVDLVSCRNLLIYFGAALQRRVVPSLHYGLRRDGYLVLGRSESIGGFGELFEPVDKKHKIFRKLVADSAVSPLSFAALAGADQAGKLARTDSARRLPAGERSPTVREEADKAVLAAIAPAGVTVDSRLVIVDFRGDTSPYLNNRPGRPTHNLLDMLRDELVGQVRAALAEAQRTGLTTVVEIGRPGVGEAEVRRTIDLKVVPFNSATGETHCVVLFEGPGPMAVGGRPDRDGGEPGGDEAVSEIERLRGELNATRERLEAVIEEKEAANEELRAANEEMLSAGEEMQSINEERRDLVGGDFHDVFRLPDGKVLLLIGDVAGKGVRATALGETVRVAVRATAQLSSAPDRILANVHALVNDGSDQFVTALVVLLDPATGETILASAGHPPLALLSATGCSLVEPQNGTPLGSLASDYPVKRLSLTSGDTLVLYTDGVIEARRGKELFGEERLIEVLLGVPEATAKALVEHLQAAVIGFADELKDDLQVVALRLT